MEQIVELDPAKILVDDNSRFSLKVSRVNSLGEAIVAAGRVRVPVEVEPMDKNTGGFTHRLNAGFYRHAAVTALNKGGAKLLLPAFVRPSADPLARLKDQLSENMDRENQSPMDQAVAIRKLLDAGMSRMDVRTLFARPGSTGTKKNALLVPASNAWVNIMLSFLDLPKPIQTKIHEGLIGVKAAYQLGKVPADRRQAVIDAAESERERELASEAKDEEQFLRQQQKAADAKTKVVETTGALETAKAEVNKFTSLVSEKEAELKEVQKAPILSMTEQEQAEIKERLASTQNDIKSAQKLLKDSKNAVAKLVTAQKEAEEKAERTAAQLDTKKAAKVKPATVTQAAVKKAEAKTGGKGVQGYVALTLSEIRQVLKDVCASPLPSVALIGKVVRQCCDGVTTPKELMHDLGVITGEETGELTSRPEPVKVKKTAVGKA